MSVHFSISYYIPSHSLSLSLCFQSKGGPHSNSVRSCNHHQIVHILRHELLGKREHSALYRHRERIVSFFEEKQLDGQSLYDLKRRQFVQSLTEIECCGQCPKVKHSLIVLYKAFFRMDLSEIEFPDDGGGGTALSVEKRRNKWTKKKRARIRGVAARHNVSGSGSGSGCRFWYWTGSGSEDRRWCVVPRFSNLKEEMLCSAQFPLSLCRWDSVYSAGLHVGRSGVVKSFCCESSKYATTFGVERGRPLSMSHVLAVMLYTDCRCLAQLFLGTFLSPKSETESVRAESLLSRHSVFANWARLLRETVECFGRKMKDCKTSTFYRVADALYTVHSVTARFYPPTSCTTQLAVAMLFAPSAKGAILELEPLRNGMELTAFHCGLLSARSNEEERLFIGGARSLRFGAVRVISAHSNYRHFLAAMAVLDDVLCAKRTYCSLSLCSGPGLMLTVDALCRHQASVQRADCRESARFFRNVFPEYVNALFARYCSTKRRARISVLWLDECYPALKGLFTEHVQTSDIEHIELSANDRKGRSKRVRFAPEVLAAEERPRRRRHTVCCSGSGRDVPMAVVCGEFVFDLLPTATVIQVDTKMDGVCYDIVRGLPQLAAAYKLDAQRRPLKMEEIARKRCEEMTVKVPRCTVLFVQNSLYQFPATTSFYVGLILRVLDHFFVAKCFDRADPERGRNAPQSDLSQIDAILKWRFKGTLSGVHPQITAYFVERKEVHFNLQRAKKCLSAASLLHSKMKRMPRVHVIAALFVECAVVTVYGVKAVTKQYLQEMVAMLLRLNKSKLRRCKLRRIVLDQPIKVQCTADHVERVQRKLLRHNWKLKELRLDDADKSKINDAQNVTLSFDRIVMPSR